VVVIQIIFMEKQTVPASSAAAIVTENTDVPTNR
jgi:hypothetical protein